ncbi:hypothetical protein BP6252_08710 [Coleophoma cylindrospora]|uniref:Uncharacterized protein n=1 Tax=Coleophoma cylindrospora TaxID=1849047 RepID=A0A3D8R6V9_9HELO|nr:hypothetical protein BP6252_08710 [Coleophoma cylindrospora]
MASSASVHKGGYPWRSAILLPTVLHTLFAALVVYIDRQIDGNLRVPASIIPSLSIVVGLMLVFRNQTSYERFWTGRNYLATITTSCRNLARSFLTCSALTSTPKARANTPEEDAEVRDVVGYLIAMLYIVKNHLRAEWGENAPVDGKLDGDIENDELPHARTGLLSRMLPQSYSSLSSASTISDNSSAAEYARFLPAGLESCEDRGLGLALELSFFVERFIMYGTDRNWFSAPQASQMQVQLNTMIDAYGRMETIRLTPIPIAHMIHQKQVLALFGAVLPFAMVADLGWWSVPLVTFVIFTLYGIEAIGQQLEDPFGYDRNDIKMDAIVADIRVEIEVLLDEWKDKGSVGMFLRKDFAR